jgi:HMG (high mobility group) box/LysM domain
LGGLGCGRTLVKLVVEQLENLKPSARANYDYVVLQATDNSIPFYESLGFVRVGAVMQQENVASSSSEDGDDDDDKDASYSASSSGSSSSSSSSSSSDSDSDDNAAVALPLSSSSDNDSSQQHQHPITALATPCGLVSSKAMQYITTKPGETPTQIAKKFNVNVYDIIFLNQSFYPEIAPSSKTKVGTLLLIPNEPAPEPPSQAAAAAVASLAANTANDDADAKMQAQPQPQQPIWYIAKENETPRSIANKLGLNVMDLVNANKQRLQGLLSSSRLKDGTRVKVSQFDSDTELYKPYAHWTFPDDKFEEGEPSYMMALKLNRTRSKKGYTEPRPFANSLAVPVVEYQPNSNNLVLVATAGSDPPPPAAASAAATAAAAPLTARQGRAGRRRWQSHQDAEENNRSSSTDDSNNTSSTTTNDDNDEDDDDDDVIQEKMPKPPLKPAFRYPYRLFCADFKRNHGANLLHKHMHASEAMRIMGDAWRNLSPRERQAYEQRIARIKHEYETSLQVYRETMARIRRAKEQRRLKKQGKLVSVATAAAVAAAASAPAVAVAPPLPLLPPPVSQQHPSINLFNKVVKLKPGSSSVSEGSLHLYEYWYVLTYIPDLQWCHLAPLYKIGRVFGETNNGSSSVGRPIWKLVDEELGEEVDISSSLVIPVKVRLLET